MTSTTPRELAVRNPWTGAIDFTITAASDREIADWSARLRRAQPAWGEASIEHRIAVMQHWADRLERDKASLIEADSIDTGYGQISRVAPDMVINAIRRTAAVAPRIMDQARRRGSSPALPHIKYDTLFKPYPLAGIIGPWNAPLMLSTLHVIAPLFAGCAVLVKPSEVAPRFVKPMMETIRAIPELAEVLVYVVGDGLTGQAIVNNADIINFTGSVANGRKVAETCAKRFIPAILELGGKDPVIITQNADLEQAATAVLRGAVTSTGQVCFSIERIYVQRTAHDRFVDLLIAKAAEVRLNYPDPHAGQLSPFIFERQAQIVDSHIDDALAKGAVLRCGGKSEKLGGGLYMRPTLLTGVNHDMLIMRDETFGPVMPVMAYDTEEEAIRLANDSYYGLSAAVIGGDEAEARRIGVQINAGMISLQDTFLTFAGSGVADWDSFNYSGLGGRGSGILTFLRKQALLTNTAEPACFIKEGLKAVK
ncbi:MAG: hypothetical protein A3I78_11605 [Gammaproteobacteria bacterium RIFCSPLOWO2_02_FULL_56_15]|nr:MAG: hypothetical protein A3I78_11605 [Gammaproteobacteria bacterium RIFCSPLOWO2_02_FULL_56_15]